MRDLRGAAEENIKLRTELAAVTAERDRMREVLLEADQYLTRKDGVANFIGSGSLLHRQFKDALKGVTE